MTEANKDKDFFISYSAADRKWAEWIGYSLEEQGYRTILPDWDFSPGSNFVLEMDEAIKRAKQVIAVLSPEYLAYQYGSPAWAAMIHSDPQGKQRYLIPIRVQSCELKGLLASIVCIDLVNCEGQVAQQRLLKGISKGRLKPKHPPHLPHQDVREGQTIYKIVSEFSGKVLDVWNYGIGNGVSIVQHGYLGGSNQHWYLLPVTSKGDLFKIVSEFSGKVLDVWKYGEENGVQIVQHDYLGGTNQHWRLIPVSSHNDTVKIVSEFSGKVLDVWKYGEENRVRIVQHDYLGGTNQHWRFIQIHAS
jgi:hypothetical protein